MAQLTIFRLAAALLAAVGLHAQALQIISLSPQGEVSQVRQVVAKFDAAAVNFGDAKAAAPLTLSCSDAQATKGTGRWTSERERVLQFDRDLPPGIRCELNAASGFKSPAVAIFTSSPGTERWCVTTNTRLKETGPQPT